MKSKVAKLKAVDAWRPTRDDPAIRALAKEITAMFMASMPPDVSAEERRQRFAEFGKESQAEFRGSGRGRHRSLLRCADFFEPS